MWTSKTILATRVRIKRTRRDVWAQLWIQQVQSCSPQDPIKGGPRMVPDGSPRRPPMYGARTWAESMLETRLNLSTESRG